jgi:hypothetical protein
MIRPLLTLIYCFFLSASFAGPCGFFHTTIFPPMDIRLNSADPIPESYYNYQPQVDMNGAPESSPKNSGGFKRNANWFWKKRLEMDPDMFGKANTYRIKVLGLAPQIDETWVKYNPTHASFNRIDPVTGKKMALHHHHVNQGNYAVALPAEVHRKWSGILHQQFKKGADGLKGKENIKSAVKRMNKGLGVAGIILDLKGAFKGDPHNLLIEFQPISKNAKPGQIYYDKQTKTYIVAHKIGEWDVTPTSGPHKNWKRVVWISQYVDYAWDVELRKYVGIGLLAEGYQIYYTDGKYRNIQTKCFSNSPDCLIL